MGLFPERRRCGGNIAVGETHGKCQPMDTNRGAVGGWGIRGCPWVTPIGFTHGCVLVTALRFLLGCIKMCVRVLAGIDPQSHTRSV